MYWTVAGIIQRGKVYMHVCYVNVIWNPKPEALVRTEIKVDGYSNLQHRDHYFQVMKSAGGKRNKCNMDIWAMVLTSNQLVPSGSIEWVFWSVYKINYSIKQQHYDVKIKYKHTDDALFTDSFFSMDKNI